MLQIAVFIAFISLFESSVEALNEFSSSRHTADITSGSEGKFYKVNTVKLLLKDQRFE